MADEAFLPRVNSLKEPGLHLECAVHREEAQNHFCVDHGCTLIQCSISTLPLWHKPPLSLTIGCCCSRRVRKNQISLNPETNERQPFSGQGSRTTRCKEPRGSNRAGPRQGFNRYWAGLATKHRILLQHLGFSGSSLRGMAAGTANSQPVMKCRITKGPYFRGAT